MNDVTGFFHVGITVEQMERSLRFYRDCLGLDIIFDREYSEDYLREILALDFESIRIVYLGIPGGGSIELLEYRGIERLSAASRPCDPGCGHISLYVSNVERVTQLAAKLGYGTRSAAPVDITAGPNSGARNIYLLDPDGYSVELVQPKSV